MKQRLKTTKEVYGVSPITLQHVSYIGGLLLRLEGVREKYKEAATEWHTLIITNAKYSEVSDIDYWMAYLAKAEKLTRLQLSEAFNKDLSNFTLPTTLQVYGINPTELALMSYPEALSKKLDGVKLKLKDETNKVFVMYNSDTTYEDISKQDAYIAYLGKARKLTEFQIEELKDT